MLLVQAGSGVATLGLPDSPGVPANTTAHTLVADYNDLDGLRALFAEHGSDIAGVIVEPIAANMGFVLPAEGYLQGLRDLTREHGALLIFDEVMTGFRVSLNGAQGHWGITPDLTCLGKVIGGGLPVGAYGGRREIMQTVAPAGPMYQAGTLSGNPLAMVAGLTTLQEVRKPGQWEQIAQRTARLAAGLQEVAAAASIPVQVNHEGSMFGMYFLHEQGQRITDYPSARQYAHTQRFATFFWAMAERGVYLAPSQFEAGFVSLAHSDADIDATLAAAREAMGQL
jgi:glutamate-1-semialdehyde 2,1-aminomutase